MRSRAIRRTRTARAECRGPTERRTAKIVIIPAAVIVGESIGFPVGAHAFHAGLTTLPIDERIGDLVEELAGHHVGGLPPLGAYSRARDIQPLLGAGDAHIGKSAFLLQFGGVLHRTRMRERALFHAGQEHHRVFEALGRVQGHQRHFAGILRLAGQLVGIGHERGGLQECG